ncbi:MAG: phosphosulfolactate synthase, partial [Proteobacteria bacterium]|nr:phosphosulfolactate synthase [Pseudomonadota bacterium]
MSDPILTLSLPERSTKPRQNGISNLVDNGYGLIELEDKLNLCHPFIDIVKLGWASAYITTALKEKVALFKRFHVRTCLGGMMFEISYWQNQIEAYRAFLEDQGIDLVEVSNGSLPIPEADKCRMVEYFAKAGF